MTSESLSGRIVSLADQELENVKTWLGTVKPIGRIVFLIEVCRVLDAEHVLQFLVRDDRRKMSMPDFDTILRGWNMALGLLLESPPHFSGIPMSESTEETRIGARTLLHQLGRYSLLKETAEMMRFGMANAEMLDDSIVVRMSERVSRDYFLDRLESHRLTQTESRIPRSSLIDSPIARATLKDHRSLMERLVFPWDSGHGMMIGYHAEPELDYHFLAAVADNTAEWRNEAGIHPDATIEGVQGSSVAAIGMLLISLYLKHIQFVDVGKSKFPNANYAMSLTIWKPTSELTNSISEFTGMAGEDVAGCLDLFTVRADHCEFFRNEVPPFVPMLIQVCDDYLLSPVSSMFSNPFLGLRRLAEYRSLRTETSIREPREEWMINDLYHLFLGTRYQVVNKPTSIKRNGNTVTDIDAAVLDRTTGDMALFQLKWQDFTPADIRKRMSKAKNFVEQVDLWAEKIENWVAEFGIDKLRGALGLPAARSGAGNAHLHLFAIGRLASRFQSYGYEIRSKEVALCTWPQFVRLRYEVGPVENVLGSLHARIVSEHAYSVQTQPMPHEIIAAGQRIRFEDLWNSFPEFDEPEDTEKPRSPEDR